MAFALWVMLADTDPGDDDEPVTEREWVPFALFVGVAETTFVVLPVMGAL